ncbi:ROK family protein [Paenibacillus arenilitoris]|uniref:ROK family protein n=1 Tax=Paenibacillus arenilitoris TaxID=2772299 RepID=A0A927CMK3_9BACL|nr:ROK family protein [Paenibacillus arenilitoris]MBD2870180.1 ROK family protein [Paenibacillus arenilitoris]
MKYAVGVDIGGTKIQFALVDEQGRIARGDVVATEAARGAEGVMQTVVEGIDRVIGDGCARIEGIGIGSAGQIDFRTGEVSFAVDTLPGWTGTPIKQIVERRFGLPAYVDNDVNAAAVAEKCFGAGRQLDHFVCLALGTGIGGAIVESGRLLRGASGGAGELGHVSVDFNGPRCSCGNYGCVELYASGPGIARLARETLAAQGTAAEAGLGAKEVLADWSGGAAYAALVMDRVIRALASAVAGIIHAFNPQAVIIGGGVSGAGDAFFAALAKEAAARTSPSMRGDCRIVPAGVGANAGVIGAAAQVWHYGPDAAASRVAL